MAAKLTRLTHKIAIQLHLVAVYLLQFSLQAASPETFGYAIVLNQGTKCDVSGLLHVLATLPR
jgi:hypothetical protein